MKKIFHFILIMLIIPLLCGCQQTVQIKSEAGGLGHRADQFKNYIKSPPDNGIEIKHNVIYMGKEYENNTFGPGKIKFVFEK